ncbi:MAG: 5-(carboxyamino)imidazole ribonucleotide synthase [Defluviitaleaceae bacterium]|nr:5-(carboxyamino)imidazole ribonucleotide synthase [Defluviitaleaceae bacterium]
MTIQPYQTIGIIGGGQLGRMMALSAKAMGYYVAVLDPTPNCPAAQVSDIEITAAYNDMDAIMTLAEISDVITYEFENIDYDALTYLEKNAYLPQGSNVLKITQHRFREKTAIKNMGIPVPTFHLIGTPEQLAQEVFYPSVLKTTTGGYDGKGQVVLKSEKDLPAAMAVAAKHECILEAWVPFCKEISVIVARSTTGETAVFPVSENIHVNNILHLSIVPARISPEVEAKAIAAAKKIATELDAIGLLAIEMFVMGDEININELAPRPHNSGHYTMDACVTSQFEQHVRAVCGLPLGDVTLHSPVVMVNILGDHMDKEIMHNLKPYLPLLGKGKIHLYGKVKAKDKRKMGHINILGDIDTSLKILEDSKIWETKQ